MTSNNYLTIVYIQVFGNKFQLFLYLLLYVNGVTKYCFKSEKYIEKKYRESS